MEKNGTNDAIYYNSSCECKQVVSDVLSKFGFL